MWAPPEVGGGVADRMAATTHDVRPDQMMAAAEFLEAEWHEREDWDPETSEYCRAFDEMCERFASGYSPKDATAFLRTLLLGCRAAPSRLDVCAQAPSRRAPARSSARSPTLSPA